MYLTPAEQEVDRLEAQLDDASPEERKELERELAEIARYEASREQWEEEGFREGWL